MDCTKIYESQYVGGYDGASAYDTDSSVTSASKIKIFGKNPLGKDFQN